MKLNRRILPRGGEICQRDDWKQELTGAFRDVDALLESLSLRRADIPDLDPDPPSFGLLVPRGFAALMQSGDPEDPLLRQVLPLKAERLHSPGLSKDPVGDAAAEKTPGLLQKYAGRSLVIATGACAVNCRYCFRRHFHYADLGRLDDRWARALSRIAADETVQEVILSGGDPLMLDDARLAAMLAALARVPHLRRVRIHSRLPVVLPSRVTERLAQLPSMDRISVVMVIHANHPRELGSAAEQALRRLAAAGIALLNQSVLLRGVNDDAATLVALSERLLECGVLPYYLHQLDPVEGAGHFQVSDKWATMLVDEIRGQTSGYLVPRLVREIPGARSKTRIA